MTDYSFAGRVVLLTGATGGLGRELAHRLSAEGALLLLTGRHFPTLQEFVASLPEPSQAQAIDGDLTSPGEAERLAREALSLYGHVDVLINNAGMGYFALVEEATDERIRQLFELNTFTPLTLMQKLGAAMRERGEGRMINIASAAGRVPIPTVSIYGGSKSALAMIANTMRLELEPSGVTVINIYPGTVRTSFEVNALREREREGLDPSGRSGRSAEEIAGEVLQAARGKGGEVWLEREGRWMAASALMWPAVVERLLRPLRDRALAYDPENKPHEERRWRLLQVESSIACNLKCIICPWTDLREEIGSEGLLREEVWAALRPHLPEVASVDLSGGGEPLLHPRLVERLTEAKAAGCTAGFLTNGMLLDESLCQAVLVTGADWVGFSLDGASAESYESIRPGADFSRVTENIQRLTSLRLDRTPQVLLNVVMMPENIGQLEDLVRLAARLGVDRIQFKQCDVVRGERQQRFALFASKEEKEQRRYKKALARAQRLARRLHLETSAFSFEPEVQPVCEQDPRTSLFVRYDGKVAPCIMQAYGGEVCFLGERAQMPAVHYGSLPHDELLELWESPLCQRYRQNFNRRMEIYDEYFLEGSMGGMMYHLRDALHRARDEMPPPPHGCQFCHYLYDI